MNETMLKVFSLLCVFRCSFSSVPHGSTGHSTDPGLGGAATSSTARSPFYKWNSHIPLCNRHAIDLTKCIPADHWHREAQGFGLAPLCTVCMDLDGTLVLPVTQTCAPNKQLSSVAWLKPELYLVFWWCWWRALKIATLRYKHTTHCCVCL